MTASTLLRFKRLAAIWLLLSFAASSSLFGQISTNNVAINFNSLGLQPNQVVSVTVQGKYWAVVTNTFIINPPQTVTRASYPQMTNGGVIFSNQICGVPYSITISGFYGLYQTNYLIPANSTATNADGSVNAAPFVGQYGSPSTFFYAYVSGFNFATNYVFLTNFFNVTNNFTNFLTGTNAFVINTNDTKFTQSGFTVFGPTNFDFGGAALAQGAASTNFTLVMGLGLTNLANTNGINGTNFTLRIGQNDTNFTLATGLALTNLIGTNGINGTNFTLATGLGLTNLVGANGAFGTNFTLSTGLGLTNLVNTNGINGTNFTLRIGQNDTNFTLATGLALTNLVGTNGINGTNFTIAMGLGLTNLIYTNGINSTNFTLAAGLGLTNLVNTNGINGTNFVLRIGQNDTNFTLATGLALTNLIGTNGINGTNFTLATGLGMTNLIYTNGVNGTNLTLRIGQNDTNFTLATGLALTNLVGTNGINGTNFTLAMGLGLTNLIYTNGINSTNFTYLIGQNLTNYVNSQPFSGNFIANNSGLGTNTLLTNGIVASFTNFYVLGLGPNAGAISFPRGDQIYELANGSTSQATDSGLSLGNGNGIIWSERGSFVAGNSNDVAGGSPGIVTDATVVGGLGNIIGDNSGSGSYSTIVGGALNKIPTSSFSTILGGWTNQVIGSTYGTTIGGYSNLVTGVLKVGIPAFGIAAGADAIVANNNSVAFNDNSAGAFSTTATNQFIAHFFGGYGWGTNNPHTNFSINAPGLDLNGIAITNFNNLPGWANLPTNLLASSGGSQTNGFTPLVFTNVNQVVYQSGSASNVVLQQTTSLGGNTNWMAQGSAVFAVVGAASWRLNGSYLQISANGWTNLYALQHGMPGIGCSTNGVLASLNDNGTNGIATATTISGPWTVNSGPAGVPVSWIGASNQLAGIIGYGPGAINTNLWNIITNQGAIAAALFAQRTTNNLPPSAFVGITNNEVRVVNLNNSFSVASQQINGGGGTNIINANSEDGEIGGVVSITANVNNINTSDGHIVIAATNSVTPFDGQGFIDIVAGNSLNLIGNNNITMQSDVYGGGFQGGSHGGNLTFDFTGSFFGNGQGATNLQGTNITGQIQLLNLTNALTVASNYSRSVTGLNATNNDMALSNNLVAYVNTSIGSITSSITANNVTTNFNDAGRSMIGLDPNKIQLVATNGVGWSLVYYRVNNYWTNAGSGFGIITNGNGATPQWNLKDAANNTLSFLPASSSPQGRWAGNFVLTNAPFGDWGRKSDFGSGGNAEAWTVTNVPASSIAAGIASNQITSLNASQIAGTLPISDLPTNTMTVFAATNAFIATNASDGSSLSGQNGNWSGVSIVSFNTNSPSVPLGAVGTWNDTETREPQVWVARGLYWMLYIGHDSSGGRSKIGIRYSTDGNSWTEGAASPLLNTNTVNTNTWNSGNLIAPGVLYDASRDDAWAMVGGTTNYGSVPYQLGPYPYGLYHCGPGLSFTNPANWQLMNNSNFFLVGNTQPWENANAYSPSLLFRNSADQANKLVTFYYTSLTNNSYLCGGGTFTLPTLPTDTVTVTKFANNPLFGGRALAAEQPSVIPLPQGGFVAYTTGDLNNQPILPCFYTADPNGQSNWVETAGLNLQSGTNTAGYFAVGPAAFVQKFDGNYLVAYAAETNSGATHVIRTATVRFNAPLTQVDNLKSLRTARLQIGTLTNDTVAGDNFGKNDQNTLDGADINGMFRGRVMFTDNTTTVFPAGYAANLYGAVFMNTNGVLFCLSPNRGGADFGRSAGRIVLGIDGSNIACAEITVANNQGRLGITNNLGDIILAPTGGSDVRVTGSVIASNNVQILAGGGKFIGNGGGLTNISGSGILAPYSTTPVAVTIGASPFTFSNSTPSRLECQFSGSVAYSISKNGAAIYGSLAGDAYFQLAPTNVCVITYSVAPTLYTNQW